MLRRTCTVHAGGTTNNTRDWVLNSYVLQRALSRASSGVPSCIRWSMRKAAALQFGAFLIVV